MWPFKRKVQTSTNIVDTARAKMTAERDHHEKEMRYFENIIQSATAAFHEHEAAYLAYNAVLERVDPTPMTIPAFTDDEFDAAMTIADADPLAELEASLNPNNELDAAFLKGIAERKAGTERKRKLPATAG